MRHRALADRELRAEPSLPGVAAGSFLVGLGDFGELQMLLSQKIIGQLYELGTARAMSWFRDRTRAMAVAAAGVDSSHAKLAEIERILVEMVARPSDDEQASVTFDQVKKLLGGDRDLDPMARVARCRVDLPGW